MKNVKRLPIGERLGRIGYLLKNTFTIVGRDRDILTPWIRSTIYGMAVATSFFAWASLLIVGKLADSQGMFTAGAWLIAVWLVLLFYKFFFYNHQEMRQSWLVAETVGGRDRSYADARADSKEVAGQIRGLAWIDMLVAWMANRQAKKDKEGGFSAFLINLVMAGLIEVWDLLNHYLIPAVAVDRVSLRDGIGTVKRLREQVPETLAGVFGIDFIGRIVGVMVAPIYTVLSLVALALGVWMAGTLPSVTLPVETAQIPGWLLTDGALMFTPVPILVLLFVGKLFSVVLERAVTSIKVIYFTIFYLQITHPDRIDEALREELLAYLRMEEEPEATGAGQPQEG